MDDAALVAELRTRNDETFAHLLREHHATMIRVAQLYVRSPAIAEEVVQETWLGVLRGIDRFEGRSSLKTWIFRILTNIAKTRAEREGRSLPFTALEDAEPAVDPERFVDGHWVAPPSAWHRLPEERLLAEETLATVAHAIDELPPMQRAVVSLRDVHGWRAEEVCNALELTETNQRVLLHRARSRVRRALERHLAEA